MIAHAFYSAPVTDHRGSRSADNVIPFPRSRAPREAGTSCPPEHGTGALPATDWAMPEATLSAVAARKHSLALRAREAAERAERPDLRQVRDGSVMLCLLVDLENSFPQVWRRVEVAADLRLDQLHHVISEAMGWEDVHLHGFRSAFRGDAGVVLPTLLTDAELDDAELDDAELDVQLDDETVHDLRDHREIADRPGARAMRDEMHESQVSVGEVLADVGDVLHYDYDMACGWRHVITVEGVRARFVGEARAALLAGERACPPEDCGGVWTYNDIVAVLTGEGVDRLQTHPDDVLDQIDWLPQEFDPAEFDLALARTRVEGVDLFDLPPPMPPQHALTPALADLAASCDTKGRRALAHLLAEAGLDALTLIETHRRALTDNGERHGAVVIDTDAALAAGSGPGADLPAALDEAACERMVAPFSALLDAIDRGPVSAGEHCPFSRKLVTAAVALRLVACRRGTLMRHPSWPADSAADHAQGRARRLATHIAHHLPLGEARHEIDAGILALLIAAAGYTKREMLAPDTQNRPHRMAHLCRSVIENAGWRTRAGRVDTEAMAFWADETWAVLSMLSGGAGPSQQYGVDDAAPFSSGTITPHVQVLARAALRISRPD